MKSEIIQSKNVEGVIPRGGVRTKMPSVITMAVDHRFAIQAADFFEERKAGNEPETGLIGIKLVAVYEDGQPSVSVPAEPVDIVVEEGEPTVDEEPLEEGAE